MSARGKKSPKSGPVTLDANNEPMRKQDRIALDRLIAEQREKDEAEERRREEIARWNRSKWDLRPTCVWAIYFIILAVLSPIVFVASSYVASSMPDPDWRIPAFAVVALWALVSVMQFQVELPV